MADLKGLAESIIGGNMAKAKELTQSAVQEGVEPGKILGEGLIAGMNVVGDKFKKNEFYVPEVLIAARAMHAGMDILKPILAKSGVKPVATVVVGTVKGDLHDIGKNLVVMMLEGAGFDVVDAGVDVDAEKFASAIQEKSAKLLGMSALLTTTMPSMKTTIDVLQTKGLKDKVKIMVGGAPLTQEYADEIGADGYAPDAASAVDKAKELLSL
ncbi:methyltransferase [Candidatus Desantisbacteria bacterium CG1_02_38_46]|uniref:Methyltransferase n=3 Tax=unclassified Candidatus Desantisiibacteriota TaxID=3106372 RepID=A0A1J4SCC5_9BACT|nr:MAG: methyltransferase [Candidatus Desantisbacteria bacterium CG1_02_38_46]PIU52154.1 MAG: cobalamin-binding protein [Candidatus Desantisbacteria bacterium CG07_land_8_20_14_0_80_39_15]